MNIQEILRDSKYQYSIELNNLNNSFFKIIDNNFDSTKLRINCINNMKKELEELLRYQYQIEFLEKYK